MADPRHLDWESVRHLLGVEHDKVVAARLGCTPQAVGAARRRMGIEPAPAPPAVRHDDSLPYVPWLGKLSDREVAARFGVAHQTVFYARKARGIPAAPPKVAGPELTDEELAKALRTDVERVRAAREELGMPAAEVWKSR